MWTAIFFVAIASACGLFCLVALLAARTASRASESLHPRLPLIESQLRSLQDTQARWQEVVEDLANQVKMTKVRKALHHTGRPAGEPDAKSDPEGWRAWKNAQLRAGVYNQ